MLNVAQAACDAVRRVAGVEYVDARVVAQKREWLGLRFEEVERLDRRSSLGLGVRVLFQGAWGFSARPGTSEADAVAAAREAVEIARAAARVGSHRVVLAEDEPPAGQWQTPVGRDPFALSLEDKLADLRAPIAILSQPVTGDARVLIASAQMLWRHEHKWFASTEGGHYEQVTTAGGAGIKIVVARGDEVALRTWPMDQDGGVHGGGYEIVERLDLEHHAARIREEALALLDAELCPQQRTTLVLDTPQLALQIHESCGHPTEADRALGEEISLAGASFMTPDRLGKLQYGSERVNLTADSRLAGGMGTFGWDDEGVAARRTPLVARGRFVGYLSSRETAAALGLGRSAGCMRAESWSRPPIIRMINVSLDPDPGGPRSLEELVADTDDGVLMTTNRSWSIDDLRLNFQFGCEAAWEIKRGKRTRLFKQPLYTGKTPEFWRGCDAVGAADAFDLWGFVSCGKGDPMQIMAVGHGCAPARFRNVEVGSSRRSGS